MFYTKRNHVTKQRKDSVLSFLLLGLSLLVEQEFCVFLKLTIVCQRIQQRSSWLLNYLALLLGFFAPFLELCSGNLDLSFFSGIKV